ncbi:MAG: serine hydrolase [Caulobacteraceae bacterium]|nr:serine hydrolase [Caulobacteraceae bacterium]
MKRRDFAIGLGGAALAPALGRAASAPASADWPTAPLQGDLAAVERAWALGAPGAKANLGRTDAVLIVQNGRLVFERYGADHGPTVRHVSWSMAKSITQALVGIAVGEGRVNIDQPLKTVAHPDPKLTLRSLVTLTDGLKWDEGTYSPVDSDATKMLYGPGRLDGAAYLAARPRQYPPGTHWNYSTGAFQLAAAELQAHLFPDAVTPEARRRTMSDWIRARLFQPLGMTTALAEFDPAGTFYGGSLVYASARDFARFGELYRLDGVWGGRRILPEGWVRFAHTPTVEPTYGAGFWLEAKAGSKPASLMAGQGPLDAYSCQGHAGQIVLIVPSKAAVVVRLGLAVDDDAQWRRLGQWITPVVKALPDSHLVPGFQA